MTSKSEPLTVKYEIAGLKDAERISYMSRDLIEKGLGWRWHTRAIRQLIAERETVVLCAKGQQSSQQINGIIGFGIMQYDLTVSHLILLAVDPKFRRRGIAQKLLNWLESTALYAGIEKIQLEVREKNLTAIQFYELAKFTKKCLLQNYYVSPTGKRENAIRMEKTLRPQIAFG